MHLSQYVPDVRFTALLWWHSNLYYTHIYFCFREGVTDELLTQLGLNIHTITTPALAFLQQDKMSSTTLLNDYDEVLEWVKEQLMVLHQKESQSKEEQGYLPVQEVGEFCFCTIPFGKWF